MFDIIKYMNSSKFLTPSTPEDAARIAEDTAMRSSFIYSMLLNHEDTDQSTVPATPRIIVQYWDTDDVPHDVMQCIETWRSCANGRYSHKLFNKTAARSFISDHLEKSHVDAFDRCTHPAMGCDYFRLCFLAKSGGLYVDADDVWAGLNVEKLFGLGRAVLNPLCYDISAESMVPIGDAIRDDEHQEQRIFYINNNPLIAPPGHALIKAALQAATTNLLADRRSNDIQSLTGPGNLSRCLVLHASSLIRRNQSSDFTILDDPERLAISRWPLKYRNDDRNWRIWESKQ